MESVDESKLNYKRLDQSVKRLVIQSLAAILKARKPFRHRDSNPCPFSLKQRNYCPLVANLFSNDLTCLEG